MKTLIKVSAFFTLFFFSFNLNGKTPVNTGLHFDFYQNADRATWKTTTHGTSDDYTLRFGIDHRHLGSARRVKKTMEDGKVRHVLHTHPRWTSNGVIRGYYPFINKIPAQPDRKIV